jgi:uncharacterized heparinase superfamily protein
VVADKNTGKLALRTIVVSGRAALAKVTDPGERQRIEDRIRDLLAQLEARVIAEGADEEMLEAIERSRQHLWE